MLRYLIHVVGDIHQPLHSCSLYSKSMYNGELREGDMGGNKIPVNDIFKGGIKNLHALWDSGIGLYQGRLKLPLKSDELSRIENIAVELMDEFPIDSFQGKDMIVDYNVWI